MLQAVYMQDMQKAEWDGADGKGVTFPQKKPSAKADIPGFKQRSGRMESGKTGRTGGL